MRPCASACMGNVTLWTLGYGLGSGVCNALTRACAFAAKRGPRHACARTMWSDCRQRLGERVKTNRDSAAVSRGDALDLSQTLVPVPLAECPPIDCLPLRLYIHLHLLLTARTAEGTN